MCVIKKSLSSVVVLTTFLLTTSAFAMDTGLPELPEEIKNLTAKLTAYQQCLEDAAPVTLNKTLGNLRLVCKGWQKIIEEEKEVNAPSWKAWYGVVGHEDIYQQFLNETLIYKPNPQSDEGMIQLKISDLLNPLEGTFDLSKCGDTGKYLSILTGYRKGMKSENKDKLEIWLTPRFMVEKKLKSSARHLQPIMDNWKEEFGMFWSWGGWHDLSWYDYLTSESALEISSKNLYDNWDTSIPTLRPACANVQKFFMFICAPK